MSRKRRASPNHSKPKAAASPGSPAVADDVAASDPAAAHFFSAPPVTYDDEPALPIDAELVPRRVPASPARRRRLGRVVAGALALSCAICVAAGVRVATVRAAPTQATAAREGMQAALPPAETLSESSPPPPPDTVPANGPVAEPAVEAPQATATDAIPVTPQAVAPTAPSAVAAPDPAAALVAKRTSQGALERGNAKASIEAGEQSVRARPERMPRSLAPSSGPPTRLEAPIRKPVAASRAAQCTSLPREVHEASAAALLR